MSKHLVTITEEQDRVIRSLAAAADELGMELDLETLVGLSEQVLDEDDDGWYTHSQMYGSEKSEKHPKGISAAEWKSGVRWDHRNNKRINIKEEVEQIQEAGKQHIEVTHVTGEKSKKPVHPDNAFKALNHYKSLSTTRSARIVSEEVEEIEEKRGLWDNIHAKRKRIKAGSGERMRKPGSEGAPTAADLKAAANEEIEQIVELSKTILRNTGGKMLRKGLEGGKDAEKHMKSANLASAKLYPDQYKNSPLKAKVNATEEVEQIQEIGDTPAGKKALGKVINRRKDTIDMTAYRQGVKDTSYKTPMIPNPLEKKLTKSHTAITNAVKRLTREDIINRALNKYIPEEVELPSLDERLIDRLDSLEITEQHIHILLSMFENLNEQNKIKMIETANSTEGVNSLIDFAISNKGTN